MKQATNLVRLSNPFKSFILLFAIAISIISCDSSEEKIPDISSVPEVDIEVIRIEKEIIAPKSKEAIATFLNKHKDVAEKYFRAGRFASDTVVINNIYKFATDAHTDTLLADTEAVFANVDKIEKEFEQAFRFLKYYYPGFKPPKVYTNISGFGSFGFGQDIFLSEGFIVIGLDYFTGETATYRPPETPLYILGRYAPEYIVPSTMMFISSVYNNYNNQDETLIADMVFYGKSYEFVNKVMPYTADTIITGYSSRELGLCNNFQDKIWARFIEDNLFYEKAENIKSRYVGERPIVPEISDKCPGRVGRWLGWEIVKKYMHEHPDLSLKDLMDMNDAQMIFQKSKYKPVKGGTP
ncbi:gliding motility lipoprotein GldB [Chondrinema litorale]|uniref:gliding motility lipoprotein GldB n=1 Tax=Chondrinema litorale TaxID=2994555 RepID=UPI002543E5CE|nr:gliding motility lipoprotein GldB [Chondrinema litorale]UZR93618.1 gliding motility lipoprotein GldB [Chondrinema litorale]